MSSSLRPNEITFPVYPIKPYEKIFKGSKGALILLDKVGEIWVLDDVSYKGSFGRRRLQLKANLEDSKVMKLYPLKKSCNNWSAMLSNLQKVKSKTYIDATGRVFTYAPSKLCKLTYHRILKVQQIEGKGCLLILEGLATKLKVPVPPPEEMLYAGVLHSEVGFLLYQYCTDKLKDTHRKI